MKRILFLIVISAVSVLSYAQTEGPNHEVYFSCGTKPLISIPTPDAPFMGESINYVTSEKPHMTINIGFAYHMSDPFAVGIQYSYSKTEKSFQTIGSFMDVGDMKNDCHTIMMTFKYDWLNTGRFRIYTRAAAGSVKIKGDFHSKNDNNSDSSVEKKTFAWHISPVGLDWAFTKNMGLFMEGGIGYSGCGIAGIRVLF